MVGIFTVSLLIPSPAARRLWVRRDEEKETSELYDIYGKKFSCVCVLVSVGS